MSAKNETKRKSGKNAEINEKDRVSRCWFIFCDFFYKIYKLFWAYTKFVTSKKKIGKVWGSQSSDWTVLAKMFAYLKSKLFDWKNDKRKWLIANIIQIRQNPAIKRYEDASFACERILEWCTHVNHGKTE